jgi:hypothetical protein
MVDNRVAQLQHIMVKCPTDGHNRKVDLEYVDATDDDCEMCGSHGHVILNVLCSCGSAHEVCLTSW